MGGGRGPTTNDWHPYERQEEGPRGDGGGDAATSQGELQPPAAGRGGKDPARKPLEERCPVTPGSQTSGLRDRERVRFRGVQAPGLCGLVTAAAGAQEDSFACPRGQNRFRPVGRTPESALKAAVHRPGQTAPERRTGLSCLYLGSGHPPASGPAKREVPRDHLPAFAASPGAQSGSRHLCGQQAECGACREPGT